MTSILQHGVWGNLNLCSQTTVQSKLSLIPLKMRDVIFAPNNDGALMWDSKIAFHQRNRNTGNQVSAWVHRDEF